jgi:MFS family permease
LRAAAIDIGPLRRHRDFRLLFIGRSAAMFGGEIRFVALPYQVYHLTHSPLAVGLLGLTQIGPILVFALIGGALADAHDRRWMVQITESGLAVISVLLVVNALIPHPLLAFLYIAVGLMAGLDALQNPSLNAMVPRLVDRDEITAASAVSSVGGSVGLIAGPAMTGVLIVAIGLPGTYGIDVACFVVSLITLSMMRAVPPAADAEAPSLRRIREGFQYARSRPVLLGTYLVDMTAMFFGMPNALFPAIATRFGGPGVLGLLYAAPSVGVLVASGTSGWTRHVHRHGLAVILAATGWGLAIVAFGLSPTLPPALVCLALAGGSDEISALFRSTIWNQAVPDSLRGRLAGIELISFSSGPALGELESGTVASLFNVRFSVISGGVLCVLGTALLALALPDFRRYDAREELETEKLASGA